MTHSRRLIAQGLIFFITLLVFSPALADEVQLKNGDRITGKVVIMEGGQLVVNTAYAGEIKIKWSAVSTIKAEGTITVVLEDDALLKGVTRSAETGGMALELPQIQEEVSFDLARVKAINPKPKKPEPALKLKGQVNVGATVTKGNTDTGTYHFDGEAVARTRKNRFTIGSEFNRAEDQGEKTVNNALASLKYDYFVREKWFLYSNALFEKDEFRDIKLRSALGVGGGHQFWESPETNLSLEGGLTYVNEDFDVGDDDRYPAGRWALNYDKYFFHKKIEFFHFHEGFVSLEDADDLFIRARTGLRFPLYKQFKATAQFNYDWDNQPAPGDEKGDEMYVFSVGYHW